MISWKRFVAAALSASDAHWGGRGKGCSIGYCNHTSTSYLAQALWRQAQAQALQPGYPPCPGAYAVRVRLEGQATEGLRELLARAAGLDAQASVQPKRVWA